MKYSARFFICEIWVTFPKMEEAFKVIRAWGFEYKTVAFTWVKQNKKADSFFWGMGYWTRDRIVELMGDLPRIELFARQKTSGWDVWGNEVESDIELVA